MNEMKVSAKLLPPFLGIFQNSWFQPTLERPRKRRPGGGRGKQRQRGALAQAFPGFFSCARGPG